MERLLQLQFAESTSDFANLLGYKAGNISYILYHYSGNKYTQFEIPKKTGGTRIICAPCAELKELQSRLADYLYLCLEEIHQKKHIKDTVSFGYQKNKSIYDNSYIHRNRRYVFNLDLQDFFSTITFPRIRGFFIKNKFFTLNPHIATLIAQTACYNGILPQGSPLSPIITILIGSILDNRILALSHKYKCSYTRYVDDITFSTNQKNFPSEIAYYDDSAEKWMVGKELESIISNSHFLINHKKVSMQYKYSRQNVVGLVVNKKVNVNRDYYKTVRAMCNSLFRTGTFVIEGQEPEETSINQLEGMLNFIFSIKSRNQTKQIRKDKNAPKTISTFQKLYIKFCYFSWFFINPTPIVFTEGKTDGVYLKCALQSLKNNYPKLVDSEGQLKIKLLYLSDYIQKVLDCAPGSNGLLDLCLDFKKWTYNFNRFTNLPVFVLFDHDSGFDGKKINKIKNLFKDDSVVNFFSDPNNFPALSINLIDNLYLLFTDKKSDHYIEKYFEQSVLDTKISGKSFTHTNDRIGDSNFYGKQIFSQKVIKPNKDVINFSNFIPLFDEINSKI